MTTLNAHFDGKNFVPDEPLPPGLSPNTKVTVTVATPSERASQNGEGVFDAILKLAVDDETLPRDFAAQHDHYIKGLPKR